MIVGGFQAPIIALESLEGGGRNPRPPRVWNLSFPDRDPVSMHLDQTDPGHTVASESEGRFLGVVVACDASMREIDYSLTFTVTPHRPRS
jgi:hypothetical protein